MTREELERWEAEHPDAGRFRPASEWRTQFPFAKYIREGMNETYLLLRDGKQAEARDYYLGLLWRTMEAIADDEIDGVMAARLVTRKPYREEMLAVARKLGIDTLPPEPPS